MTDAAAMSSQATSYCPTKSERTTVSIWESGLLVKIYGSRKLFQTVRKDTRNTAAKPDFDNG